MASKQLKDIVLVTGNKSKLKEFVEILKDTHNLENISVDLPELQGKQDGIDIAKQKCLLAFKELKRPCITEDTSLCFNALNGLPGPYIKWFLESMTHEKLHLLLSGFEDKSGYAQCIVTYMDDKLNEPLCFVGQTQGKIVQSRGDNKFGWDPVFQPEGYEQTYAEMDSQIKNSISHRRRAIDKFRQHKFE